MRRIGLSIYSVFLLWVVLAVAGIATLALHLGPADTNGGEVNTVLQGSEEQAPTAVKESLPEQGPSSPASGAPPRLQAATPSGAGDEASYRAHVGARVRALAKLDVSDDDRAAFAAVLAAIRQQAPDTARLAADKISSAAGRKLARWLILRAGFGRLRDYRAFLADHPRWPDRALIRRRLEQSLFINGGNARDILSHFKDREPAFGAGYAAMASAHLALENTDKARELAAKAWCGGGIANSREDAFLQRFAKLLDHKAHSCRLDRLLVDNLRWRSARRQRAVAVRRVIKLLDKKDQKRATARLAAFLRQRVARKWLKAVPQGQRKADWGFHFQYIQHLRLANRHSAASKLLKTVPTDPAKLSNVDAWWEERHANALNALQDKRAALAYKLVADIRPQDVNLAKDQAWFAGWLALRKLGRPKTALKHFKHMLSLVDGPLSSSKAHYWLGRTYSALKRHDDAARHYQAGAGFRDTFHGLLAKQTFEPDDRALALPLPAMPNDETVAAFIGDEAVRAGVIAIRVGLARGLVLKFFRSLAKTANSEGELALLAQLAAELGDGQLEVRTGKTGIARGFNLYIYSYPLTYLPKYEPLRAPPERAVVLAIGRQESEFNTRIVSGAGARGILQVMPVTARHVCRQYKIKCQLRDLIGKPAHNTRIATAYIADRTDEFAGSYILAFAGYNAGPGRTRQWLRKIGDPRKKGVQPLDWIYRIPFYETRTYVQKVLSNVQVYRARLGLKHPVRLLDDINRAR